MAGAGQTSVTAVNKAEQSLTSEIGEDNPLYETLKSKIAEAIEEARESPEMGGGRIEGEGENAPEPSGQPGGAGETKPEQQEITPEISPELKKQLEDLANFAYGETIGNKVVKYADVDNNIEQQIKEETDIDIRGYKHGIDAYSMRHIRKQHGNPKTEADRGQIAIVINDYNFIPSVVSNPDYIVKGKKTPQGLDSIWYVKKINGYIFYLEEVRTDKKILMTKTMIKSKPKATASDVPAEVLKRLQ
jgi:hypothetical protein